MVIGDIWCDAGYNECSDRGRGCRRRRRPRSAAIRSGKSISFGFLSNFTLPRLRISGLIMRARARRTSRMTVEFRFYDREFARRSGSSEILSGNRRCASIWSIRFPPIRTIALSKRPPWVLSLSLLSDDAFRVAFTAKTAAASYRTEFYLRMQLRRITFSDGASSDPFDAKTNAKEEEGQLNVRTAYSFWDVDNARPRGWSEILKSENIDLLRLTRT